MYQVILYDNPYGERGRIIHSPNSSTLKIDGSITKEINLIPSFRFSFTVDNHGYGDIRPYQTFIEVTNIITGDTSFKGRVLTPVESVGEDEVLSTGYICEGEEGYLHDSVSQHMEFRGSVKDLLIAVVDWHNEQTEDYKHFTVGDVEVSNTTDNMYVYLSAERTTFEELQDKFINRLGGEFQIRTIGDTRYLDYLEEIGEESVTEIRIARNLMSFSKEIDPTQVVSRLTPLGTRIESENPEATDASEERLTIKSVNNGIPYIDREDLKYEVGIQGESVVWDDVTEPENLLRKAKDFINNQKTILYKYVVRALDLSTIGEDIDSFNLGWYYHVINPIMNINERLRVVGIRIDINDPEDSSLTIGDKFKTLREYQSEMNKSSERISELQGRVASLLQSNTRLSSTLQSAQEQLDTIESSLVGVDIGNLPEELQTISQQIIALQNTLDNLEISEYNLVTPTSDGLMSAQDKTKLDLIHTTKIVNLDNVLQRLESLEQSGGGTPPEEPTNENLITNSNDFSFINGFSGSSVTRETGVSVNEWDASDATKITITGGSGTLKSTPMVETGQFSKEFTYSFWVKNIGGTEVEFGFNGLNGAENVIIQPNEDKRVVVTGTTRSNLSWFQHQIRTTSADDDIEIVLWRRKLEEGDAVTPWTPTPEDD